jgi:hypothetical protein
VTAADWRALIEAYLDGRLSAEAFMRRFVEAWRASGGRVPPAVAGLQQTVEAFEADVLDAQEDGAVSDDELRQAAQRALANLSEDEPAIAPHTFDRTRAREEMRRFQVQMTGCAGVGCVIALIWVALCVLQIYFVSEWIQESFEWGAWPSAVAGFILAFVPIVGNVLAYLGATQEGWPSLIAAIVFFAAPAATLISGWTRWRRQGPRG